MSESESFPQRMPLSSQAAIARIDERTRGMASDISEVRNDVHCLKNRMDESGNQYEKKFVSRQEFWPVRAIVFGFVALVMLTVMGGVVLLVVR